MTKVSGFSYDIQYTKAAEKFFRKHEDVVYTISNGTIVVVSTLLAGSRGDVYKKNERTEIIRITGGQNERVLY